MNRITSCLLAVSCLFAQDLASDEASLIKPEIIPLYAPLPPIESEVPESAFLPPEDFAPPLLRPLPKTPVAAPAPSDTAPIAAQTQAPSHKTPVYGEHFQTNQPEPFSKPLLGVGAQKEGNSFVYSDSKGKEQQMGNMTIFGTNTNAQNIGNSLYFPIQNDSTAVGNKIYYPSTDGKLMPSIR